jgi:hypothetical protein
VWILSIAAGIVFTDEKAQEWAGFLAWLSFFIVIFAILLCWIGRVDNVFDKANHLFQQN